MSKPTPLTVHPEQGPLLARHAALLGGAALPPLDEGLRAATLRCGDGATLLALAAAWPRARFWGVDAEPERIEVAREAAAAAGLANVTFTCAPLHAPGAPPDGPLHHVFLDGVASVLPEAGRAPLTRWLDDAVRPGGLVVTRYDAAPLWRLMRGLGEMTRRFTDALVGDDPTRRAAAARELVAVLRGVATPLRDGGPVGRWALDALAARSAQALLRSVLDPDWTPRALSDVAAELAPAGLELVGVLPLSSMEPALAAPARFHATLETARDRLQREVHADIICPRAERVDVFLKAGAVDGRVDADAEGVAIGAWREPEALFALPRFVAGEVGLPEGLRAPLAAALATRADTPEALRRAMGGVSPGVATRALRLLVLGERLCPFVRPLEVALASAPERLELVHPVNALLLARRPADAALHLAAPAMGGVIALSPDEARALEAWTRAPTQGPTGADPATQGPTDADPAARSARERLRRRYPWLRALGVVR